MVTSDKKNQGFKILLILSLELNIFYLSIIQAISIYMQIEHGAICLSVSLKIEYFQKWLKTVYRWGGGDNRDWDIIKSNIIKNGLYPDVELAANR